MRVFLHIYTVLRTCLLWYLQPYLFANFLNIHHLCFYLSELSTLIIIWKFVIILLTLHAFIYLPSFLIRTWWSGNPSLQSWVWRGVNWHDSNDSTCLNVGRFIGGRVQHVSHRWCLVPLSRGWCQSVGGLLRAITSWRWATSLHVGPGRSRRAPRRWGGWPMSIEI